MQSEPQGQGIVVGQVLDGWRLDAELGKGGMGLVYHAIHLQSGVVAALKVLLDDENATVELQRRFRREVKALARLDHPGVVRILAESLDHVPPYFCMELLPGGSLTQRLEWTAAEGRAGLPPERFEQLVRELAAALEVLHAARLLHRDLKPGNVLFTAEGHAKLTDFGMVKAFDLSLLTVTPRVMGTMAYLAPETLRGEPFDVRTDLYQLGVTLFEAATGKRPYTQREIANAWSGVALPPPPSVAQVSLPAAVAMPWLQGV
ncbi:MAG: serine/threonine protein kinase, partial [Candidatus Riflebacteria bacterium]|nr:serine/threonine protein kinase [Candidatus Riflebacteria bacterium]